MGMPQLSLPAGQYWLAVQAEPGVELGYDLEAGSLDEAYRDTYAFGNFPAQFNADHYDDWHWAVNAVMCVASGTPTPTMTPTPVITATPYSCDFTQYAGSQSTGNTNAFLDGNFIGATRYQMHENGYVFNMSAYVPVINGGNIRMAVYADNAGEPGNIIFQTGEITAVTGWNTADINNPVHLEKGRYWLAVQVSNTGTAVDADSSAGLSSRTFAMAYSAFPGSLPAGNSTTNCFTIKAAYCPIDKWFGNVSAIEKGRLARLDSPGYKTALGFYQPVLKQVNALWTYVNYTQNSPQYRIGIQAASGGLPSGTYLVSGTVTPSAAGWLSCPITPYSLSPGHYFVVIEPVSSAGASSYSEWREGNVPGWRIAPTDGSYDRFFYAFSNFGGAWKQDASHSSVVLQYSDGTSYGNPYNSNAALALHNNNNGDASDDRVAMQVMIPGTGGVRVDKIGAYCYADTASPGGNLEYFIYDEAAKVTMTSGTISTNINAPLEHSWVEADLAAPIDMQEGGNYKIFLKSPDSPSTNRWYVIAGQTSSGVAALQKGTWLGEQCYAGFSTNNGSSFTAYLNYDCNIRLRVTGPAATATATATFTATITRTTAATPELTATRTITPSVTQTFTIIETTTPTVTHTFTSSVSPTVTRTVTETVTRTATPSVTPTYTMTKSATPTVTQTVTGTVTHTVTETITPTVTPSFTATTVTCMISGIVTLPAASSGRNYFVIADTDMEGGNGYVNLTAGITSGGDNFTYSLAVPAGTYYVYCVVDENASGGEPDNGDYIAVFGGVFPSSVPPYPNAAVSCPAGGTFDMTASVLSLSPTPTITPYAGTPTATPVMCEISGTITLPYASSGSNWAVLVDTDYDGDNGYIGIQLGVAGTVNEINYSMQAPEGTYYLYAVVDADFTGLAGGPTAGDFIGFYGGSPYFNPPATPNALIMCPNTSFDFSLAAMPTPTATRTVTGTWTNTATPTFTLTGTPTNTRTSTGTSTRTVTATNTPSFTPSVTQTSSPTGTVTQTATPTFAAITGVSITSVPARYLYPGQANELVLQINIEGGADILTELEVRNETSDAAEPSEITGVFLWYQPLGGAFNTGTVVSLGQLPLSGGDTWRNPALSQYVAGGGSLYVTVNVSASPASPSTIQMSLRSGKIRFQGIGGVLPVTDLVNPGTQTIVSGTLTRTPTITQTVTPS
ncbi:MAG TPA: hypothetical protein P5511_01765, partial [Candidatus Goldiibacteriota bacterium]|nr:hypothetical protein [Candidatus Goldiibacteriota bacterium]